MSGSRSSLSKIHCAPTRITMYAGQTTASNVTKAEPSGKAACAGIRCAANESMTTAPTPPNEHDRSEHVHEEREVPRIGPEERDHRRLPASRSSGRGSRSRASRCRSRGTSHDRIAHAAPSAPRSAGRPRRRAAPQARRGLLSRFAADGRRARSRAPTGSARRRSSRRPSRSPTSCTSQSPKTSMSTMPTANAATVSAVRRSSSAISLGFSRRSAAKLNTSPANTPPPRKRNAPVMCRKSSHSYLSTAGN